MTNEIPSKVHYCNLFDCKMDILKQLVKLNNGSHGMIKYPIQDIINYKKGERLITKTKIKYYKNSIIAYLLVDTKIVSWGLLLYESKGHINFVCKFNDIKKVNTQFEFHLFTKKGFRKKGYATRITKSIRRKFRGQTFVSYYDRSDIFVKNKTLYLEDLD